MAGNFLKDCIGFEWDTNNKTKNDKKHNVLWWECEQVFFNQPLLLFEDTRHSISEQRFYVLGQTNSHRKLFIVFTIRKKRIRIISAREMHKKEKSIYEEVEKTPKI